MSSRICKVDERPIYIGTVNTIVLHVLGYTEDYAGLSDVDLTQFDRAVVELGDLVLDTDVEPTTADLTSTKGRLVLRLGLVVPEDFEFYGPITIKLYKPGQENGWVVIHSDSRTQQIKLFTVH